MAYTRPGEQGSTSARDSRVLLVEDNRAASRGMARLLEAQGYLVTVRHDGASALRTLEAAPPPDIVLTDLDLPDLDGREVAEHALRLEPRPRIGLITGWDLDPDDGGDPPTPFDRVFLKPLDAPRLFEWLRESRLAAPPPA
jgi:CheY-like chemotaxis protein